MKILIISNYSGYFGSEKSLEDIVEALHGEHEIVTYMNPSVEIPQWYQENNHVKAVDLGVLSKSKKVFSVATIWRVIRIVRKERPDKILLNISLMPETMLACYIMRVPLYVFVRESLVDHKWLFYFYSRFLRWVSTKLVANSLYTSSMLGSSNKTTLLYNRIDAPEDIPLCVEKDMSDYEYDFIFVGRLSERKGIFLFLRALQELDKVLSDNINVAFVGDVKTGEEEILSYIIETQQTLQKIAVHIKGFQRNPLPFISSSKALVAPSLLPETFGRIIVEACSVGTPVISTDVGAYSEINPFDNLLFNPASMNDFVEKLETMVNIDYDEFLKLKKKAISYSKKYSFEEYKKSLGYII